MGHLREVLPVMPYPMLEQPLQREKADALQLPDALKVRGGGCAEALDRSGPLGGEVLQRGRHRLDVVVPLTRHTGTIEVGERRSALAQDPEDTDLVPFDVDIAQMQYVLP